ncbi:TIGR00282 family metallophosphoesterase [Geminisphaera colitermitum]|uniref:TIGR00282 family metallophosphoesterase n=1 Tax=Geminisphaera colitermitum TaxID=1148786 RepID=UPI001E566DA7|nr:TIGR00282 family metallophosphoesterase [Geminisphaera colitermitum]
MFIGDIVGRPGREILAERLGRLRRELGADVIIANGENAAAGSGINESIARSLLAMGIDAITLGDHVWDQRGWDSDIGQFERVSRPANLPATCPGRDHLIVNVNGFRLGIITLLGRHFLKQQADCPFLAANAMLARLDGQVDGVFVEIHAEATSEKQAMGWHLDGRAIAVLGTHTHVPTADATVLPGGTAFMCDVGMTGPYASILGRTVEPVLGKFIDGMPRRFEIAEGDVRISGALVEYDETIKRAVRVELVTVRRNNVDLTTSRL